MSSTYDRTATFNYLVASKESSLFRNGQVLLHRDPDGNDSGITGLDLEEVETLVRDARALTTRPTVDRQGFELLDAPLTEPDLDFFDAEQVARKYYPEVAEAVAQAVGARFVAAFDHNVRWAQGKEEKKKLEGGQEVQAPIQLTHGDYTLTSAPNRLRQLTKPPSGNDTLKGILPKGEALLSESDVAAAVAGERRFGIINMWRNIAPEPVQAHPLAVCDATTVEPKDFVVFEIHYQDRIGENYFAKHDRAHRWCYFSRMTRDEPMLIKQWDSTGEVAASKGTRGDGASSEAVSTFSLHSAFEDPETPPDAPDRRSIEVRCVVMW